MSIRRTTAAAALAVAALAGAATPATAAPWSTPAAIPGAAPQQPHALFTAAGRGVVLATSTGPQNLAPSVVAEVSPAGAIGALDPQSFAGEALATYGADRIAVAGETIARSGPDAGTIDDSSSVVVRFGTPAALGAEHVVAGTRGQHLYALSSNRDGLMALVTGHAGTRNVFVRRPGASSFAARLRIKVSSRARDASVAVGRRGDLLVVYEDAHEIRVRHIGPRGTIGAVHRLGAGVQSRLQPLVGDDGRLAVAWESQRVNEGEAATPAIVSFATAAPGRGFGAARPIATAGRIGAGRYVATPGVRLLAAGDDALLAYTGFDGTNYTVQAAQVRGGHVGTAERLSPTGLDAVLGDAAATPAGRQVVAWRAGVAGADPSAPHTPLLASVRGAGATAFGPAEAIGPADADVLLEPAVAIDPVGGAAIAAYGLLTPPGIRVAARPGG